MWSRDSEDDPAFCLHLKKKKHKYEDINMCILNKKLVVLEE